MWDASECAEGGREVRVSPACVWGEAVDAVEEEEEAEEGAEEAEEAEEEEEEEEGSTGEEETADPAIADPVKDWLREGGSQEEEEGGELSERMGD